MKFTGKTALVTGATRGIGKAIAEKLLENGITVIIGYAHSDSLAKSIVAESKASGNIAIAAKFDLSDIESIENSVKEIRSKVGNIDYLVNNAGIAKDNLLVLSPLKDIKNTIDINLISGMMIAKVVVRGMIKNRFGSIVNISSIIGEDGGGGQTAYAASKAGVIGFTKALAKELASRNIRVNAVAPGFIKTDMTKQLEETAGDAMIEKIPMKKFGKPEDVANLALFLLSDSSAYITGTIVRIDGGLHL